MDNPADKDDEKNADKGQLEGRSEDRMRKDHEYGKGAQEQRICGMPASFDEKSEHIDDDHDRCPDGGEA
jgi:hypothetical protein